MLAIDHLVPNPWNKARMKRASKEAIKELAASIEKVGVLQPILVRAIPETLGTSNVKYEIVAGERRWRAAQKAGLERVPVVVRESTPIESLELALIENIHRKDLNPIEEAMAYKRWLEDASTTQEALAKKLGRERSTITNMLRLLKLPQSIQKDLINERLSMGHARLLVGLKDSEDQKMIRDLVIKKGLSVRQLEELLKKRRTPQRPKKRSLEKEHYFQSLADNLKRSLGTKVEIRKRGKRGSINIYFYSDEELDRLLEILI